ncbi:hypothetical protein G6F61_014107 [Rhizopus arrhizus]|nr:hypothetical protein G6F61_014107 [Rhizopus arrhizus]
MVGPRLDRPRAGGLQQRAEEAGHGRPWWQVQRHAGAGPRIAPGALPRRFPVRGGQGRPEHPRQLHRRWPVQTGRARQHAGLHSQRGLHSRAGSDRRGTLGDRQQVAVRGAGQVVQRA